MSTTESCEGEFDSIKVTNIAYELCKYRRNKQFLSFLHKETGRTLGEVQSCLDMQGESYSETPSSVTQAQV